LIKFLKRLFCRHAGDVTFVRNLHGDQVNEWGGRSVWRCQRGARLIARPALHEEPKAAPLSPRFYPASRAPQTQTARTLSPAPSPRRDDDSAPSAAPSLDQWSVPTPWAAAAAVFQSQRGGDFGGAGASGSWDAPSACPSPSPSYDSSSSDSGSCSSDSSSSSTSD